MDGEGGEKTTTGKETQGDRLPASCVAGMAKEPRWARIPLETEGGLEPQKKKEVNMEGGRDVSRLGGEASEEA